MIEFRQNTLDASHLNSSYDLYHGRLINSFMHRKITREADQPIA